MTRRSSRLLSGVAAGGRIGLKVVFFVAIYVVLMLSGM